MRCLSFRARSTHSLFSCFAVAMTVSMLLCADIFQRPQVVAAEESPAATDANTGEDAIELPEHFTAFSELLTGATLVGQFTLPGVDADKPLHEERYEIHSVKKSPRGDYWLFMARITYGDHDVTVPLPLEVKWAGTTPVITLDGVTIPKLGTFDARVVIDGNQYAGTWKHDNVGGHMFGRIEPKNEKPATDSAEQ